MNEDLYDDCVAELLKSALRGSTTALLHLADWCHDAPTHEPPHKARCLGWRVQAP